MERFLVIFLGMVFWSACARAEPPSLQNFGHSFAPVGGLVALSQEEPVEPTRTSRVARVPDSKITYDVQVRLLDPTIGATKVEVRVKAQHVTLIGPVTSGAQADDVERAVRAVLGVYALDNQMWVP